LIAICIILSVILLIFILLFAPVSVRFYTNGEEKYSFYIFGIKFFDSEKEKHIKTKKSDKNQEQVERKETKKEESKIAKLFFKEKEKNGTVRAIKFFAEIFVTILKKLVWFIKKLKFRNIDINLFVGSENAAKTAIEYGVICTALYPLLSLITTNASVKYKAININADFNSTCISGEVSFFVTARPIYAIIAFIKGYKEYKNIMKESVK